MSTSTPVISSFKSMSTSFQPRGKFILESDLLFFAAGPVDAEIIRDMRTHGEMHDHHENSGMSVYSASGGDYTGNLTRSGETSRGGILDFSVRAACCEALPGEVEIQGCVTPTGVLSGFFIDLSPGAKTPETDLEVIEGPCFYSRGEVVVGDVHSPADTWVRFPLPAGAYMVLVTRSQQFDEVSGIWVCLQDAA